MNLKEIIRMDALYYSLNINKNDINENNIKYIEDLNNNISNFNSNYTSKFSINPSNRSEINLVNAEAKSLNNTSHISSTNSPVKSKDNNNNTNITNICNNKLNSNTINTNREINNLSVNSNITTPIIQKKSLKETQSNLNTKNVNKVEDLSNVQEDCLQNITDNTNKKSPVSNKYSKASLMSNTKKSSLVLFNNYNKKCYNPAYGFKVNDNNKNNNVYNNNVNKSIVKYDNITIIDDSLSNKNKNRKR